MKQYFIILLLALVSLLAYPQQDYLDSLKRELIAAKEDTNKVKLYATLARSYQWGFPDTSFIYSEAGLQLARKLDFTEGEIRLLAGVGQAFTMKGNYAKALEAELKALELAEKLGNPVLIRFVRIATGDVYFISEDYNKALSYYKGSNNDFTTGLLGECYFHLDNLDSALYYLKKAYDLDKKREFHWPIPYEYLGAVFTKKEQLDSALYYYREGIANAPELPDFVNCYIGMADIFKKTNRLDSAIYYGQKAIRLSSQESGIFKDLMNSSKALAEIFKIAGKPDSAMRYLEIEMAAKDSLFKQGKQNLFYNEQLYQRTIAEEKEQAQNKLRIYFLLGALAIFSLIVFFLWRNNRHKQKAKSKIEKAYTELKSAQSQLIQSEKMASLGELTAGIAHEIQNPLNFVNNFSEVNNELIEEVKNQKSKLKSEELDDLLNDIFQNNEKINHHGKRADAIVKGMLQHSRTSSGQKEITDINALCDEYLRLAYYGLRAKDKSFNAKFETNFDPSLPKINVVPQDIGRVILNLINNAFYAVSEKKKQSMDGYEPNVTIQTKKLTDKVEINVEDNGGGIPEKVLDKIFQPFFTTKPPGQGTGLGLSLSYDIIKAHGGEIVVDTHEDKSTQFTILLPV